jgi:hypothetical protein
MAWAHSQQLSVLPNGGLYPYPALASTGLDPVIAALADSLKSLANGGACRTNYDLAFYGDAGLTDLLPFEPETAAGASAEHDLTTGDVQYWVGVPETQGVFWMAWGDVSVASSLKNVTDVWADPYLVSPVIVPGPILAATGFVFHCADDAATANVVNSVVGSANTCAFRLGDHTDGFSTAGQYGPASGLSFTGGAGNNGLFASPDVLDFLGAGPGPHNDNEQVTIEITFKITSGIGSGNLSLTANQYFAEHGYFLGINASGKLFLTGAQAPSGQSFDGATTLVHDTWYHVTAIIDHEVGYLYLGTTLDGTGPLDRPYASPVMGVETGFYPNAGYWVGVIDEWRMFLGVRDIPVIPTGSLTVRKTTAPVVPSRVFNFTAASGLVPATFSLHHGEEQVFSGITPGTYSIVEAAAGGWDTSYSISNGGTNTAIVVGNGDDVIVTVTNSLPYQTTRRLRRSPHINEEKLRIICDRFELDLQAGLGTTGDIAGIAQYSDPIVMVRVSRDGGQTWGPEQQMTAGAIGEYQKRCFLTRLGQGRDLVFEVTVSDPTAWYLVNAYGTFRKGTS